MKKTNKKKGLKEKSGINPVTAGVVGAVVGAGIAIAGAVAMEDEKNREKVKRVLADVKSTATDYVEDVKKQVQDKKSDVEEKLAEGKEKIEKAANAAKDSLDSK